MQKTSFTEMRRQAKKYFDAVEAGETIEVTRRGKIIARIVPADSQTGASWKKPAMRVSIPGSGLSEFILNEREEPYG